MALLRGPLLLTLALQMKKKKEEKKLLSFMDSIDFYLLIVVIIDAEVETFIKVSEILGAALFACHSELGLGGLVDNW